MPGPGEGGTHDPAASELCATPVQGAHSTLSHQHPRRHESGGLVRMLEEKLARARLLIVDDDEADTLLLRRILENGGYTDIRSTNDPAAAADLIERLDPDLILLDLLMPVMDGYEVLQVARALTPEDDYRPVLVLTADHRHDAKHRALSGGARDFLTKPFSPDGGEAARTQSARDAVPPSAAPTAERAARGARQGANGRPREGAHADAHASGPGGRVPRRRHRRAHEAGGEHLEPDRAGARHGPDERGDRAARGPPARRREDRDPGLHPPLPGTPDPRSIRGHEDPLRDRRRPAGGHRHSAPGARGRDRALPPRALGRVRLSAGARG